MSSAWSTDQRHSPPMASSSSGRPRSADSGSPPASAPTAWRGPAAWAASWPNGSWTAGLTSTRGRWTRAGSGVTTSAANTRWRGHARSIRPITTSSTPATSAAPAGRSACRRRTLASKSSAPPSARSPAGRGPTGSIPTPRAATNLSGREAGPAVCGRRRSGPSIARVARPPPSSISPRLRRSRCAVLGRRPSWRDSLTTASPVRSVP